MTEYRNNYANLVVLGGFNPAILTHEFLVKECDLQLGSEPHRRVELNPVVSSLEYNDVSFFADLGRLEIKQKNCADPKSSFVADYLACYMEKLPYTPVTKCGTNLSYVIGPDKTRLDRLNEWLRTDRRRFYGLLKHPVISLEVSFHPEGDSETVVGWVLKMKSDDGNAVITLKTAISDTHSGDVSVDFNYEVSGLDKDKSRLHGMLRNYAPIVDLFMEQVGALFGA